MRFYINNPLDLLISKSLDLCLVLMLVLALMETLRQWQLFSRSRSKTLDTNIKKTADPPPKMSKLQQVHHELTQQTHRRALQRDIRWKKKITHVTRCLTARRSWIRYH